MKRRSLLQTAVLQTAVAASTAGAACSRSVGEASPRKSAALDLSFAVDDNQVTFYTDTVTRPVMQWAH